jgi:hypothetical protein
VKSIHTSSAKENSAPTASTPPIALIQLLKFERGLPGTRLAAAGRLGSLMIGSGKVASNERPDRASPSSRLAKLQKTGLLRT